MRVYNSADYKLGCDAGYKEAMLQADVLFPEECGCVSNAKVFALNDSVRRAKFPMSADGVGLSSTLTPGIKALAQSQIGHGHDQWLTGVIVQFDLTFSNKAWVEMERYHFVDFVSSQSTMHRITRFDIDSACNNYVDREIKSVLRRKIDEYNNMPDNSDEKKEKYLEILYNVPSGFRLTAGITTNYRQLKTIYTQRKTHRLPEWRQFCSWIETLPHSELITGVGTEEGNG